MILLHGCTISTLTKEKARWELCDDAACCFKILKAATYKTTAVRSLTSYLTNHSSKMSKTCWPQLKKYRWIHKQCSPMNSSTWAHQCQPTNKNLYLSALYRHWVLTRGLGKRESKESLLSEYLDNDDDDEDILDEVSPNSFSSVSLFTLYISWI